VPSTRDPVERRNVWEKMLGKKDGGSAGRGQAHGLSAIKIKFGGLK